jgi:two-component system cell cycle sensor histidine kinase/response regulator CckA
VVRGTTGTARDRIGEASADRRRTVLVLQQEDSLRALVRRAVLDENYEVLEARTAMEALRIRDQSGGVVDLVITDLAQPGLVGPYGLRERLGSRTPFLYLLMYTTNAAVPEENVTFFLRDPFRGRALEEKLHQIFRRR